MLTEYPQSSILIGWWKHVTETINVTKSPIAIPLNRKSLPRR